MEFSRINVSFSGSDTQQEMMSFTIQIIDDDISEPKNESFEIVGVATRNLYFPFPVMRVTIIDNDEGGTNIFTLMPWLEHERMPILLSAEAITYL